MNPILKNVLAVLVGVVVGSAVNMGILILMEMIIPPPVGVDMTTVEGMQNTMHLLETKHYISPFLAHALGTLAGAIITVLMAVKHKMRLAMIVGFWFLIGGSMMVAMVPSPTWYDITDLALAYFPMAFIGAKLGMSIKE